MRKFIIHDWKPCYAILPKRDINGKWRWLKPMFYRRVGILGKIHVEYGTIMDVIKGDQ